MRLRTAVVGLAAVAFTSAALARYPLLAQSTKTIWDGVYSEAQGKRGEALYNQSCASCHGTSLEGGEMAPPLTGNDFNANWDTLSLGQLVERIRTTMPQENPGSLSRQQYVDIVTYLLQKGKFPTGSADLPMQADALNGIGFKAQKP
jgi:S-disulfanyl-L-cysteine oxidoreductase SoxD